MESDRARDRVDIRDLLYLTRRHSVNGRPLRKNVVSAATVSRATHDATGLVRNRDLIYVKSDVSDLRMQGGLPHNR